MAQISFDKDYRNHGDVHCVVKLTAGRKYMITRCKNLYGFTKILRAAYRKAERGSMEKGELYYHFCTWLVSKKDKRITIDILFESNSGYEILVEERTQLIPSLKSSYCLNNNVEPYIPVFNESTGMYGWFTKGDILNYNNWVKKYES